jgi:hypothetical protein
MTKRLSLTPRFIEVLEWARVTVNCLNNFWGLPDKPLKRFRLEHTMTPN